MEPDNLYDSTRLAKRLGVTRQRVDQLVESGQLPQPVGRFGRNRLWPEEAIELALAGSDPSTGRQPTPDWDRAAPPHIPLRLDVDDVLTVPCISLGSPPRVHVRIWRGHAAGAQRTVVLYGAIAESNGIIVNYAEDVARAIAAAHLTLGEARNAWYFSFWPRGFPRREFGISYVSFAFPRAATTATGIGALLDSLRRRGSADAWSGEFEKPVWQPVRRTHLARILGTEPDLDYPPGTYTAAVVAQLANGHRPATVEFDPRELRHQLRRVNCLHAYADALLGGDTSRPGLPALDLLAAPGHDAAARTAEALGIAVRVLAPATMTAAEEYRLQSEAADPGAGLVERHFFRPEPSDSDLLARYTTHRDLTSGAVHRALTTVRTLAAVLADQVATGGHGAHPDLADALAAAEPELVSVRHLLDPTAIDDPGPAPAVISRTGEAEQAYLATVSWWGPADGDAHRAAELRGHLWEKDLDGLRTGYDPYGRLVLHNPTTGTLALERPRALPTTAYPDAAEITATPQNMAAFVRLPDGRCDILPTDPRHFHTDITWGYGGAGPDILARALSFAVLPHTDPEHPLTLEDRPQATRDYLLGLATAHPRSEPLTLNVRALRNGQPAGGRE